MAAERTIRITGKEYAAFDDAYDWFNQRLFDRRLPPCLITLQRKARSHGYFANSRFGHRVKATAVTDELALNPDTFGTPPRRGYHNREWAEHMIKKTGQRISHYVIEGGPFDRAAEELLATGFRLHWQSAAPAREAGKGVKERSKTKYTCPSCGQNAWAKPAAALVCGECREKMEAQE